jgi:hypothetical protein
MPSYINQMTIVRPNTSVVWPDELPWLSAEDAAAFWAWRRATFIDTGDLIRTVADSDDGLTRVVTSEYTNLTAWRLNSTDPQCQAYQRAMRAYSAEQNISWNSETTYPDV